MWNEEGIQKAANLLGFEIKRLRKASNPAFMLATSLSAFSIDTVLDVGANIGQYGSALRKTGYRGRIVSFEPLASAHARLEQAASADPDWHVHERTALGASDGQTQINVSGNSVSSSLLPMLDSHLSAARDSAYVGSESTPIARLDSVLPRYLDAAARPFLKIDAQGYEWQVLDGLGDWLSRLIGVQVELSLVELYEGQRLWLESIARLEDAGFTLWSLQPGFTDPANGRTLQLDATFFRTPTQSS